MERFNLLSEFGKKSNICVIKKPESRSVRKNQAWLMAYKLRHPCACGVSDPACLDIHHVDRTAKNGDRIARQSHIKMLAELQFCVVLCANCHRLGHAGKPRPEHAEYFGMVVAKPPAQGPYQPG